MVYSLTPNMLLMKAFAETFRECVFSEYLYIYIVYIDTDEDYIYILMTTDDYIYILILMKALAETFTRMCFL